jgi:hypothetical protein
VRSLTKSKMAGGQRSRSFWPASSLDLQLVGIINNHQALKKSASAVEIDEDNVPVPFFGRCTLLGTTSK